MGKAGKWIRNFLIGKKDEKDKKRESSICAETALVPVESVPATPKVKRRWSFGRSSSLNTGNHQASRSLDSIATAQLVAQTLLEHANEKKHAMAAMLEGLQITDTAITTATTTFASAREPGLVEDTAATKIQAFFRSYLARKALSALRGLVKLQALVRGHLVRKQTTAMLRCMNALMAIQVRARVQRIQMAEESQVIVKRRRYRKFTHDNQPSRVYGENRDLNIKETRGGWNSQNGHVYYTQTGTLEPEINTYHSGRLSISKQEYQSQIYPNSSTFIDSSSRKSDSQIGDFPFDTAKRSSRCYSTMSKFNHRKAENDDTASNDSQFEPNYMANTKSSKAKARSQSEPKQRPVKQKSRRTASIGGITVTPDHQRRQSFSNAPKNQYPWLIKLYRSTKSIKDIDYDSTSTMTDSSSYSKTLIAYEPAVNLY